MAKKITIPYNGKTYTLEYTRKTAAMLEKDGFDASLLTVKTNVMLPKIVHKAFLANHERVKEELAMEIYDKAISNSSKAEFVTTLVGMYADTVNTLLGGDYDEEDEGNPGWAVAE